MKAANNMRKNFGKLYFNFWIMSLHLFSFFNIPTVSPLKGFNQLQIVSPVLGRVRNFKLKLELHRFSMQPNTLWYRYG